MTLRGTEFSLSPLFLSLFLSFFLSLCFNPIIMHPSYFLPAPWFPTETALWGIFHRKERKNPEKEREKSAMRMEMAQCEPQRKDKQESTQRERKREEVYLRHLCHLLLTSSSLLTTAPFSL